MYKYQLKNNRKLSPTCFELYIVPVSSTGSKVDVVNFKAGQYLAISSNVGGKRSTYRCFSIASAPGLPDGSIAIGIRIGSKYTKRLASLEPGTEILIEGPFGEFAPDLAVPNPLVLIAGGIGITPMISILEDARLNGSNREIRVLYFNRAKSDIPYLERIEQLAKFKDLHIKVFVDEEVEPGSFVSRGCLDLETLNDSIEENADYYLCGPAGFMAKATDILRSQGVNKSYIVSESFSSDSKAAGKKISVSRLAYAASACLIFFGVMGIATHDFIEKELNSLSSEGSNEGTENKLNNQTDQAGSSSTTVVSPSTDSTNNTNTKKNNTYQAPRSTVS